MSDWRRDILKSNQQDRQSLQAVFEN